MGRKMLALELPGRKTKEETYGCSERGGEV